MNSKKIKLPLLLLEIKRLYLCIAFLTVVMPAYAQLPTSPHPDPNWITNWTEDFTPDTLYSSTNYINPSKWKPGFDWGVQFPQSINPADSPEMGNCPTTFRNISFVQLSPTNWAAELKATKNTPRKDTLINFTYTDMHGYHDTTISYPCKYTVQVITTQQNFGYGYYELRMKYPSPALGGDTNIGFAFWSNASNQIPFSIYKQISGSDIEWNFDNAYYELDMSNAIYDTVTKSNTYLDSLKSHNHLPSSGWGAFHTYGFERDPGYAAYYVDGNLMSISSNKDFTTGQPDTIPAMQLMLGLGVPDNDFTANPVKVPSTTTMPFIVTIDYLHFYKLNCDTSVSLNYPSSYSFSSSDFTSVKKYVDIGGSSSGVPSSTNVVIRAKDYIKLEAGFSVPVGSTLYANACGCK